MQIVLSPLHSFAQLLDIEMRMRSFTSITEIQLSDFRNGVATFTVRVVEAISPSELGSALQIAETLHLRLEGHTPSRVELRVEDSPPTS